MKTNENQSKPMKVNENTFKSMKINENPQTRLKTNENQCKAPAPSSQIGQLYTRWQPAGREPWTKPGRNARNEASHTINKIARPLGQQN